ncbi:MAG: MFS transporter [Oscillospiraceae bacterium]|nr:MFS transporter [Oscillospiraceae bacterium]
MKKRISELKDFYILWSTQSLSQLGSAMTNFALTLWLYQSTGSALQTALLSICSYAPYVIMSIFSGALSDKWDKKKIMLVCDTLAACCTVTVFALLGLGILHPRHLYALNAINGLMNTIQSPASDVAITFITPEAHYQHTSGLRSFSRSLITILHPVLATSLYSFGGMTTVIAVDLITYVIAFNSLLFLVKIPKSRNEGKANRESILGAAKKGLQCLKQNRLVLCLILFLAGVNLVASAFDAVLPAFVLPRENGGETVLGLITTCGGIAMLVGSLIATTMSAPKDRVKLIVLTMLFSLTTENFLLSLSKEPALWCIAQVLGFLPVPLMDTNLDVIIRTTIPADMQGRVYSCRNTLQFFTIPVGFFLGGWMVDSFCEPYMASDPSVIMITLFGQGKGAGAAVMIFLLGLAGFIICISFGAILKKYNT